MYVRCELFFERANILLFVVKRKFILLFLLIWRLKSAINQLFAQDAANVRHDAFLIYLRGGQDAGCQANGFRLFPKSACSYVHIGNGSAQKGVAYESTDAPCFMPSLLERGNNAHCRAGDGAACTRHGTSRSGGIGGSAHETAPFTIKRLYHSKMRRKSFERKRVEIGRCGSRLYIYEKREGRRRSIETGCDLGIHLFG